MKNYVRILVRGKEKKVRVPENATNAKNGIGGILRVQRHLKKYPNDILAKTKLRAFKDKAKE